MVKAQTVNNITNRTSPTLVNKELSVNIGELILESNTQSEGSRSSQGWNNYPTAGKGRVTNYNVEIGTIYSCSNVISFTLIFIIEFNIFTDFY